MSGPTARDPQPGEPEYRERWQDAARPDAREVEEALAWFRENPNWVAHMERWRGPMVIKHAATIVRAALAGDAVDAAARQVVGRATPIDPTDPDSDLVVPAAQMKALVAALGPDAEQAGG